MKTKRLRIIALTLSVCMLLAVSGCARVEEDLLQGNVAQSGVVEQPATEVQASAGGLFDGIIRWFSDLFGGGRDKVMVSTQPMMDGDTPYTRYEETMRQDGYTDCAFLQADVADQNTQEVVGLSRLGDKWYGLVLALVDGDCRRLFCEEMSQKAMYLVEYGQQSCIMTYLQSMTPAADGATTITNRYELFRLQPTGEKTVLEEKEVTYQNTSSEATEVSAFFNKCNAYLEEAQVVVDPYRLQGKEFMDSADYGTLPQQSKEPTQQETPAMPQEEVLGFVQIKDPKSWLNLREGPGTNYPCVYMEPGNKKSIVKQAQGAPVTILETVETDDSKNPVWVKVRITYAGQEIVGYSSKRYIRTAE